ncbi:hypothetical protein A6V39_01450 [Candidatus Mycoplasma haematobovis]|uniref:Aminotransferase class V domain-containing protein n=2 Tax=Candidatus Mycoplasma haematobovis TaxID=432608 RepID=A0A1A9QG55_9MOLU|nr:hypothetical protein A6V39_01450 [Candidatus Mycoplasma haematobovis]
MTNLDGLEHSLEKIEEKFKDTPHILILDISQYIQHKVIRSKRADFLFFSAHKCFGPNGLGVIYAREGMIWDKENYDLDWCALYAWNEALPTIVANLTSSAWAKQESELNKYFITNFPNNEYLELLNKDTKGCIFLIRVKKEITAHDYVFYLAKKEVLVRSGLSCSWLSAERYDPKEIFRASLNAQNTIEEINYFFDVIRDFKLSDCL